jgi:hypothetical protein
MGTPLTVEVSVLDKLSANVAKMNASVTGFVNNTERGIGNLTKGFVALAAFGGIAAGLGRLVSQSLALAEGIQKTSNSYGISTRAVQEWNYVAKQSESSAEAIHKAFGVFATNAVNAARGTGTAKEAFKSLGIQLVDSNGNMLESNALFKDAMARVADIQDPLVRAAEAQRIFGKAGKELLPVLSQGSDEIRRMLGEASSLGQILDERTIKSLDDEGDKMDTFKTATTMLGAEFTLAFIPALSSASIAVAKFFSKLRGDTGTDEEKLSGTITQYTQDVKALETALADAVAVGATSVAIDNHGKFMNLTIEEAKARVDSLRVSLKELNNDFLGKSKGGGVGGGTTDAEEKKIQAEADKITAMVEKIQERRRTGEFNTIMLIDKAKADAAKREIDYDKKVAEEGAKNREKALAQIKETEQYKARAEERYRELKRETAANDIEGIGSVFSAFANANKRNAQERKNIARFEAFINTAVGITRAIPNIPLMIFAGLEGAAQQIAISNARYANGVRGAAPGWSMVGEQGPELQYTPAGASIYTSTETKNMTTNNAPAIHFNITDKSGNISNIIFNEMRAGGSADRMVTAMFDMARKKGLLA